MHNHHSFTMEITVLSAEGLKSTSSHLFFSRRLRTFITLTKVPPSPFVPINGQNRRHVFKSRVDDRGGTNPTWGDKFHFPIDTAFFSNRFSGIFVQLYTKRLLLGRVRLGWCQIPAHDIGFPPAGTARHLSYRLRARDGSRTAGVLNLAVRLEGLDPVAGHGVSSSVAPTLRTCQTVIGIPVRNFSDGRGSTCQGQVALSCRRR